MKIKDISESQRESDSDITNKADIDEYDSPGLNKNETEWKKKCERCAKKIKK